MILDTKAKDIIREEQWMMGNKGREFQLGIMEKY